MAKSSDAGSSTQFTPLADEQALESLFTLSGSQPVIIFKHSSTCPISAAAHREMSRVAADVSLVVVQRARELSLRVAEQTGIRHESPQAIILRNGQAVWSASHFDITAEAVAQAVRENA